MLQSSDVLLVFGFSAGAKLQTGIENTGKGADKLRI
jgi:hypothetical protein